MISGITLLLIAFLLMRKPFANSEQLLQLHTWGDHISVYYPSRIIRPGKVLTCFGALLTACINWVSRNRWSDAGACRQVAFKTLSVNCIGKFYHWMTWETISHNKGLNQSLWNLIVIVSLFLPASCKSSFVSSGFPCYNIRQASFFYCQSICWRFFHKQLN